MNTAKDELDEMLKEAQRRKEAPWELTGPPEGIYEAVAAARQRNIDGVPHEHMKEMEISPFWPKAKQEICRRMNEGRKRVMALEEERNGSTRRAEGNA
ncbi:MAG: hypothetical protein JWO13_2750 [Acidobacteriales bacterium]|nr:hypothetical protein [Terriglobales bacterium]